MKKPNSVEALNDFGRVRLSKSFFMRDFLYSDIAALHGLQNLPDDPDLAIFVGRKLCEELLEPIQDQFGRIGIRSAYRSCEVNGLGNEMMNAGKAGYNCSKNETNYAAHIWDRKTDDGEMGATACIIVPSFWDRFQAEGDWQKLAWWIHDTLPYSTLNFFPKYFAFNINWSDRPKRIIKSNVEPRGTLTKPGMDNHEGDHSDFWKVIIKNPHAD
jgi:hypothetical protein